MADAARLGHRSVRSDINEFVSANSAVWEIVLGVLALIYVSLDFVFDQVGGDTEQLVTTIEFGLTSVFVSEFAIRLWAAHRRSTYVRRHWVDALALLPPIRGLRVLRLLRLFRVVASARRVGMNLPGLARHRGFVSLVITWVGLGVVLSLAVYTAEQSGNGNLRSPLDAVWWGIGSLTTVGSELYPVTVEGRVAAMVLTLVGAFIFAAITATITSFLIGDQSASVDTAGQLERVKALRDAGDLSPREYAQAKAKIVGSKA